MKKKNCLISIILAAILLLSACSKETETVRPELLDAVNAGVDVALVERMDLSDISFYNASIIGASEEICFDINGYIYGVYVEPGQKVEEGEVIASLVGKNYSKIQSLEEEIEDLKEENETEFKYLEAELELEKLSGADTSQKELELKHQKELAELKVQEKQTRLDTMKQDDIGYNYIVAPRDCTVIAVTNLRSGGFVSAGTPICAIECEGDLTLTSLYISEKNIEKLHSYYALINGVEYEIEYVPRSKEELKLLSANSIDPVSVYAFKEQPEGIQAGDYAAIITVANTVENVLVIPLNSVYTDNSGKYVYKVENNVKTKQQVVTGISNATYIEICDGLEEGDSVYVNN